MPNVNVIDKRDQRLLMVVTPEDRELLAKLCKKEGMNRSEFIRHAIRNYIPISKALELARKRYEKLLDTLEKMALENIKPDLLTELAEEILADMSGVFDRTRQEVLSALIIDNFARRTAYAAIYPNELIPFPEFSKGEDGKYLEGNKLFEYLKAKYINTYSSFKKECHARDAEDIMQENKINIPVLSKN